MQIEIRVDHAIVKGYVNAIERDSRELYDSEGTFVEQVRAGTFGRAIESNSNIFGLLNHVKNKILGETGKNLKLKEDNIGLYAEIRVTDQEVIQKARENKLKGWSFGFIPKKQSWGKTDTGVRRRYLEEIELREVSILDDTRTPAYFGTSIETRDDKNEYVEFRCIDDDSEVVIDEQRQLEKEELEKELKLKLLNLELEL